MGSFISILLSYENLYEDDIDNTDNIDKYEFATIDNNENTLSVSSTTTKRCTYITTRTYQDVGVVMLG